MNAPVDYFDSDSLREDLKAKTARGGLVTAIAQGVGIVIGLLAVPVLARLLDPEDFGLVAMVAVFTGFAGMFVDAGLSMATVQRDEITRQQVSNLFWIAVGLGTLIAIVVASASPLIAWIYSEPRLGPIALALACSYLFSGLAVQHQALLRRGMQFHRLATVAIASQLVGAGAGIAWAAAHRGQPNDYWALVLIPLATTATRTLALWAVCPWRPTRPRRGAGTRQMVEFGANVFGSRFVTYFARNLDKALIGWWWGPVALGYYERAYRLLMAPILKVLPPIGGVVVPALSRVRDTPDRYRRAYLGILRSLIWLSVPLIGLLFCVAEPLVLLYFGPKWAPLTPLFQALVPMAWATAVVSGAGWAFTSWGHVSLHFRWSLVHSVLISLTVAACVPFGAFAVACGLSTAYVALRLPGFYLAFLGTPLRLQDMGQLLWRPTCIAATSGITAALIGRYWAPVEPASGIAPLIEALAVVSGAYAVVFAIMVVGVPGAVAELRLIAAQVGRPRGRLPAAARPGEAPR